MSLQISSDLWQSCLSTKVAPFYVLQERTIDNGNSNRIVTEIDGTDYLKNIYDLQTAFANLHLAHAPIMNALH